MKRKHFIAACFLVLAAYACHSVINTRPTPSRQILDTDVFKPAGPTLRVRLGTLIRPLEIKNAGGLTVTYPNSPAQNFTTQSNITFKLKNKFFLTLFKQDNAPVTVSETVRITPSRPGTLLHTNIKDRNDDTAYPGVLELMRRSNDWHIINEVDFESYLLGVVQGEMPALLFKKDALRAQAIASRTYALYQWLKRKGEKAPGWHLNANTSSQRYIGKGALVKSVKDAVAETCGLIMTFKRKVFQAYFMSVCGGNTTPADSMFSREVDIRPLSGTTCPYCSKTAPQDYLTWHASYHEVDIRAALEKSLQKKNIGRIMAIQPVHRNGDLYPETIRVVCQTSNGSVPIPIHANRFRSILNSIHPQSCLSPGLASCDFKRFIEFTGHGFGHGVGLCQYGAHGMAKEGKDVVQILQHYYPQSAFMKAWKKDEPAK